VRTATKPNRRSARCGPLNCGADHAFFNDTGARFDAPAAEEAWHRVLSWFGTHVD